MYKAGILIDFLFPGLGRCVVKLSLFSLFFFSLGLDRLGLELLVAASQSIFMLMYVSLSITFFFPPFLSDHYRSHSAAYWQSLYFNITLKRIACVDRISEIC
jgi:hypothetical protein